jgi:hypothetical protein
MTGFLENGGFYQLACGRGGSPAGRTSPDFKNFLTASVRRRT